MTKALESDFSPIPQNATTPANLAFAMLQRTIHLLQRTTKHIV